MTMAEPQARFDMINELMAGVAGYKTAHPGCGIVGVTLTENGMVIGLNEQVGNLTVATQFHVNL
jgi:hypothetical protein